VLRISKKYWIIEKFYYVKIQGYFLFTTDHISIWSLHQTGKGKIMAEGWNCKKTKHGIIILRSNGKYKTLESDHERKICTGTSGAGHITRLDNNVVTALNPGDKILEF